MRFGKRAETKNGEVFGRTGRNRSQSGNKSCLLVNGLGCCPGTGHSLSLPLDLRSLPVLTVLAPLCFSAE